MAAPAHSDNVFTDVTLAKKWAKNRTVPSAIIEYLESIKSQEAVASEDYFFHNVVFPTSSAVMPGQQAACLLSRTTLEALEDYSFSPLEDLRDPTFQIRASSNSKNRGLFASSQIPPGDIIITERPSVIAPSYLWLSGLTEPKENVFSQLFSRLPDGTATDLRSWFHQEEPRAGYGEEDIIRTYGLSITLPHPKTENRMYSALFSTIGRCNHS
jgi:hypothetical protein